jgi:hypothetical protein
MNQSINHLISHFVLFYEIHFILFFRGWQYLLLFWCFFYLFFNLCLPLTDKGGRLELIALGAGPSVLRDVNGARGVGDFCTEVGHSTLAHSGKLNGQVE